MTYEATARIRNQGTLTRSFDNLQGGRDIDSQILERMATEFGVPRWHVVIERVRLAMPTRSTFQPGGGHGLRNP